MSSTPLFDTIARRTDRVGVIGRDVAPSAPTIARSTFTAVDAPVTPTAPAPEVNPTSVVTSSSGRGDETHGVPRALVAAIDAIPAQMCAGLGDHELSDAELALVERVGDEFIRILVDALSTELDRIARDRVVGR